MKNDKWIDRKETNKEVGERFDHMLDRLYEDRPTVDGIPVPLQVKDIAQRCGVHDNHIVNIENAAFEKINDALMDCFREFYVE